MREKLVELYKLLRSTHAQAYVALQPERALAQKTVDLKELADSAFALREIQALAKDIEKEARLAKEVYEKIACVVLLETTNDECIRTEYCHAKPLLKTMRSVPKKGTPEYVEFCDAIGITPFAVEHDTARPHWPGLVEYVTECDRAGLNPPKGMGKDPYHVFSLTIRKKPGADIA